MASEKKKTDSVEESPRPATTPEALWEKPTPEALRAMGHEGRRYFVGALLAQRGFTVKDPRTLDRGMRGEPVRERDEIYDVMALLNLPLPLRQEPPSPRPPPPTWIERVERVLDERRDPVASEITREEIEAYKANRNVPSRHVRYLAEAFDDARVARDPIRGQAPPVKPPPTQAQIDECVRRNDHWRMGAEPVGADKIRCRGCGEVIPDPAYKPRARSTK